MSTITLHQTCKCTWCLLLCVSRYVCVIIRHTHVPLYAMPMPWDKILYLKVYELSLLTSVKTEKMCKYSPAAFPLRPYVPKLAQHFEKLAQQILWKWVKKMLFLDNLANFKPKLMILVQEPLQFWQIWSNWPKLKNLRGNTALQLIALIPASHLRVALTF